MHIQTLVDMQQHSTWPSLYTKWVFLPSYTIACRPASWQRDVVHWLFMVIHAPGVHLHCLLKSHFPACFPKLLTMMTQPGLSLELSQPPTFLTSPQFTDCPTCSLSVRNLAELLPATVAEPSKRKLLHVSYVGSYKLKPYNFPSSPPIAHEHLPPMIYKHGRQALVTVAIATWLQYMYRFKTNWLSCQSRVET